ncbi:hypothetical protein PENTCL1PPCAC_17575 [Pristionchus entomophagus]|uniref:SCP domain-containing protein n=1 Tax=Pristionchus entomophagus TaxID=358040 RepID=A0AAV5TM87_9BILA|nr:hypothetical protein PENTCL1PPCAC_17575 [Pristionchus entomophagus]
MIFLLLTPLIISIQSCPLSESEEVLSIHNSLRSSVSQGIFIAKGKSMPPSTTPITNLTWDCSLENSAQKVADECVFAHSHIPNIGENLYKAWSSGKISGTGLAVNASQAWADEFQKYGWNDTTLTMSLFNLGVGHATQMVWAGTDKIGCGASSCDSGNTVIVVCHYSKQGNILGAKIYDAQT